MWRLSEPLGYMRTLIFEQWQGGHYFNYLECLVPRLAAISDEVIVAIITALRRLTCSRGSWAIFGTCPTCDSTWRSPSPSTSLVWRSE